MIDEAIRAFLPSSVECLVLVLSYSVELLGRQLRSQCPRNMSTPPAELIFLPLKSSVRPEDDSSEEGKAFLELLVDKGPLFEGIVWGRSIENSDIVGIGIGE